MALADKDIPEFRLRVKKYTAASTVVSIRIPKDMLQALDEIAEETGRTRNEIITKSLEFAMEHLAITEE